MTNLDQSLTLSLIDKYTAPAKRIASVGEDLTSKLSAGQKSINKLGQQSKAISGLQRLEGRLSGTSSKLVEAKREVEYLRRQMALAGPGAKSFARDLDKAKANVLRLAETERKLSTETAATHDKLRQAGIDTRNLAGEHERLKRSISGTTNEMRTLAEASARVDAAQSRLDASLQRQANVTIAAAGMHRVGSVMLSALSSPLEKIRGVEAAKGELQSVGINDTAAIINRGREMSSQLAGIDTAAFTRAAYDIKSGISSLSDQGVAEMTASAALTAKATKADVGQMTSLFATAYGTYKKQLFSDTNDAQFGQRFSASLAASVQQFKTTGSEMQQAIQSMGAGLSVSGISLSEQLAGLGMLQGTMDAGVAGTTLKALERTAAVAQTRFADMGFGIKTLDEQGNMRSLPDMLEQMQATFGDKYTTQIGSMLQQAFGSDEAVAFFKTLWGQQDAFRANTAALEAAANQGERFTASMAGAMDSNMDSRLKVLGQRWDVIQEKLGQRMIPILEKLLPIVERVVDGIGRFIDNNGSLATGIIGVTGIVGGLAMVVAPVIVSIAALGTTLSWLGVQAAKANAAAAFGGLGGGSLGGGKGRGKLGRLKGLGKLKGIGGRLGTVGAVATGALSIGSTLMDDSMGGVDKAAAITTDVGGIGGALAGAAAGAAIGSVVPIVGTAIGGIIGGILGGMGGSWLGEKAGDGIKTVFSDGESPAAQIANAAATSQAVGVKPPTPITHSDNRQYTMQLYQQPGEDPEAFARRVMEMMRNHDAASSRGALYDPF